MSNPKNCNRKIKAIRGQSYPPGAWPSRCVTAFRNQILRVCDIALGVTRRPANTFDQCVPKRVALVEHLFDGSDRHPLGAPLKQPIRQISGFSTGAMQHYEALRVGVFPERGRGFEALAGLRDDEVGWRRETGANLACAPGLLGGGDPHQNCASGLSGARTPFRLEGGDEIGLAAQDRPVIESFQRVRGQRAARRRNVDDELRGAGGWRPSVAPRLSTMR